MVTTTVTAAPPAPAPSRSAAGWDEWLLRAGVAALVAWLFLTIALPLWALLSKSFQDADGDFVGLANYARYFSTPALFQSIYNSLGVAILTTAIVIPLAFIYAYALTRSRMRLKGMFYALAMLPLFAP